MSTSDATSPKSVPNDPQLIDFVTRQLKRGAAPADVIYEVCRRAEVQWPEAEAFVRPFVRQRKRSKPKPIVGLVFFLGFVVLAAVLGFILLKRSVDHRTVDPIVYEAVTPTDSLTLSTRRDPNRLSRERWVEAGQTILVNYNVSVKAGRLSIHMGQEWSQNTLKGSYDFAREAQLFTLVQTGHGQLKYPVTDTGNYGLRVTMTDFTGRCEVTWEAR
ncbi:MAG TPA: hypothetical protein VLG46_02225 [Anaerolineae bacterium]|nr:hypothetical protein [Anaerolineae bacterium]